MKPNSVIALLMILLMGNSELSKSCRNICTTRSLTEAHLWICLIALFIMINRIIFSECMFFKYPNYRILMLCSITCFNFLHSFEFCAGT